MSSAKHEAVTWLIMDLFKVLPLVYFSSPFPPIPVLTLSSPPRGTHSNESLRPTYVFCHVEQRWLGCVLIYIGVVMLQFLSSYLFLRDLTSARRDRAAICPSSTERLTAARRHVRAPHGTRLPFGERHFGGPRLPLSHVLKHTLTQTGGAPGDST